MGTRGGVTILLGVPFYAGRGIGLCAFELILNEGIKAVFGAEVLQLQSADERVVRKAAAGVVGMREEEGEGGRAYRDSRVGADAGAGDDDHPARLGKCIGNMLEEVGRVGRDLEGGHGS